MSQYKILHNRPGCIGCAACAAIAPDFWKMDADGKSSVKGGTRLADGREEKSIQERDVPGNTEAAESCPVNVIHIIDEAKGEKLT